MSDVPGYLSIGDFSRATHMSVKTLRRYHQIGLLEPAEVDVYTGYRRYGTEQIPTAQVIRRFRDLGMPLEEIQGVLSAPDLRTRNERIAAHLSRLEEELGCTQAAVASLRDLLRAPSPGDNPVRIELRSVAAVTAAELAVIEHRGPPADVDRAYGTLAAYVARHALAVDGAIREYYLAGPRDTPDASRWRTEIGWPVFQTGVSGG